MYLVITVSCKVGKVLVLVKSRTQPLTQFISLSSILFMGGYPCEGSRCGHWVWSLGRALNEVISGQCVFKA